jgi:hypothetical protein
MSLLALLGTTVTTSAGRTVLIEDTYPKGRVCGKTPNGAFVVLSHDLVEQDMAEENARWTGAVTIPELPAGQQQCGTVTNLENIVFVQETVCGGSSAAGGGCGAPLGVRRVYQTDAGDMTFSHTDFQEHTDNEISDDLKTARDSGYMRLRLVFRHCTGCRTL